MYGFDYDWWAEWSERQEGPSSALSPDILGTGFAFRNLDLLLRGGLPGGLFARGARSLDPTILGVGALYLLLQVFLTGGPPRRLPRAPGRLDGPRPRPRLGLLLREDPAGEPPRPRRGRARLRPERALRALGGRPGPRGGLGADRARPRPRAPRAPPPGPRPRAHGVVPREGAGGPRGAALRRRSPSSRASASAPGTSSPRSASTSWSAPLRSRCSSSSARSTRGSPSSAGGASSWRSPSSSLRGRPDRPPPGAPRLAAGAAGGAGR